MGKTTFARSDVFRLRRARRVLPMLLVSAVGASLITAVAAGPARAEQPVAKNGAAPVERPLPRAAQPNNGLGKDVVRPVEPAATDAGEKPLSKAAAAARDKSEGVRKLSAPRRAAADVGVLAAAEQVLLRPGYLLGDTSLVAYFDADLDLNDPTSWASWFATVTDVETGQEQRSATLDRDELLRSQCGLPRQFCRTFGAADGWVLTPGRAYTVTISVIRAGGVIEESLPSAPARARTTLVPPGVPAAQAAGCSCPNVLTRAPGVQALRGSLVNTATGAFVRTEQDLSMTSYGVPFQAVRAYSSSNPTAGMFGPGWSWTYDPRIVAEADGSVRVQAEDGSQVVYRPNGTGFVRPAGVQSVLARAGTGWTLRTGDQRTLTFTADGALVSVLNQRGHGVRLAYTQGRLSTLTDAAGRVVRVVTDPGTNRIRKLTLPDLRSVEYTYDSTGRLATVRDPRLGTWRYGYDAVGRLTTVKDPLLRTILTTAYGADGRVSTQTDAIGGVTRFTWNAAAQEARTTDPDGVTVIDGYRENVLLFSRNAEQDTTVHRYDANLNRGLTVDALGNQDEVGFDGEGNPVATRAADPFGYTEANGFDTRNNLTRHTDRRGKTWQYTYNDQNEMTGQADPTQAGNGYRYAYDDRGLVSTRTDPLGKVTRYEYDAQGNRTAEILPTGRRTEMEYDTTGRIVAVVDPRGTGAGANALTRLKYTTRTVYDAEDRPVQVFEPGNLLPATRVYDATGELVAEIDELKRTSTYERDAAGRLTVQRDAKTSPTRYAYTPAGRRLSLTDAQGFRTSWTYDPRGLVLTETTPRGNELRDDGADADEIAPFVTRFRYDAAGNALRSERPNPGGGTAQVDTAFDELNRARIQTDELGETTRMEYDEAGNITSMTDENDRTLGYRYDDAGRRVTGTDARNQGAAEIQYDRAGNPLRQTLATGGVVSWRYDDDGRPLAITEPRGNANGANAADYTTTYTYDPAGNPATVRDPLGSTTRYEYDAQDRQVAVEQADGAVTRAAYDDADQVFAVAGPVKGAIAETLAAVFIAKTQLVAGHGPVKGTILNLPTVTSPVSFALGAVTGIPVTRYAYDANGQLVASGDQLGRVRRTVFDSLGRPAFSADPLGRVRSVGYDADSNVTSLQTGSNVPGVALTSSDRARRTITNTYDNLNRLTRSVQGSQGPTYTYGYDANSRLTQAVDPGGTTTYAYDRTGLLTGTGRNGRQFGYEYDENDNVTLRTYPDGTRVEARYDVGDRMDRLTTTRAGSSQRFEFEYDLANRLTTTTYPGSTGASETRTYDRAGRMSGISATSGAGVVTGYDLVRDQVGNPTRVTRSVRDGASRPLVTETTAYTYDASQRLTSACYGATNCDGATAERFDYGYDLVGNRTSQLHTVSGDDPKRTLTTYAYDLADQLKLRTAIGDRGGVTAYEYDGEGNQTRSGNERFTYNLDHTLASTTSGNQTTTFGYDAAGNRVSASAPAAGGGAQQVRTWDWDVNNALPMLAGESGSGGTRAYAYGADGTTLGLYTGGAAQGSVYTHDWLGGTAAVLAADGTGQWVYDYDPFGAPRDDAAVAGGRRLAAGAPVNPLQFAGGYNDNAGEQGGGSGGLGGNYHLRARDYDVENGRFTATDPVTRSAGSPGANGYGYVDGRATFAVDPSGLAGETPFTGHPTQRVQQTTGDGENPDPGDGTVSLGPDPLKVQREAAQKAVAEAEQFTKNLGDEIVKLVMDLIGVTDAVNCIQKGDIGACLSTVLGAVPWGKMFKAAKVAIKAVGLGRRLIEGYGRLKAARSALESVVKQGQELARQQLKKEKAEAALRLAREAAAKKAAQAKAAAEAAKRAAAKARDTARKAAAKIKDMRRPGCKSNSFLAGTAVVMADGTTKPIEQLAPGDSVLAAPESPEKQSAHAAVLPERAGAPEARQVTATVTGHGVKQLVDLQLVGAGAGGGGPPKAATVTATAGHPMYVPGTGWVEAGSLHAGQRLVDADGAPVTVASVRHRTATTTVHNVTVADRHTYYVRTPDGTTVLTHNTNPPTPAAGAACALPGAPKVLKDGEGATPIQIANSVGGPTGGSRAGQAGVRQDLLDQAGSGPYTCWRCGQQTMNPANMHMGHRNVPTSKGGNLEPDNVCLEGAACNLSAGNRGAPSPGMSCAERGSCGAPYGRTD